MSLTPETVAYLIEQLQHDASELRQARADAVSLDDLEVPED